MHVWSLCFPISRLRSWCRPVLAVSVIALAAPSVSHAQATNAPDGASTPAITAAADLDKAAYAFADRYTTHVVTAADAILAANPTPEQRRAAHAVKVVSVSGIYDIVTNAEPFAKLMDALMVVTRIPAIRAIGRRTKCRARKWRIRRACRAGA